MVRDNYLNNCPKAIRIPANTVGVIPNNAFSSVPRLRHVLAEPSLHTVFYSAWQNCYQLQIVKLPATVVCIQQAVLECYALFTVVAPGCVDFGVQAFAECCSLQHIGTSDGGANILAPGATLAPHLFESCLRLPQIIFTQGLTRPKFPPLPPPYRGVPQGCFSSSGLVSLTLPTEANFLGSLACENCKNLAQVDLSTTSIKAINEHTFSHCVSLLLFCTGGAAIHAGSAQVSLCNFLVGSPG